MNCGTEVGNTPLYVLPKHHNYVPKNISKFMHPLYPTTETTDNYIEDSFRRMEYMVDIPRKHLTVSNYDNTQYNVTQFPVRPQQTFAGWEEDEDTGLVENQDYIELPYPDGIDKSEDLQQKYAMAQGLLNQLVSTIKAYNFKDKDGKPLPIERELIESAVKTVTNVVLTTPTDIAEDNNEDTTRDENLRLRQGIPIDVNNFSNIANGIITRYRELAAKEKKSLRGEIITEKNEKPDVKKHQHEHEAFEKEASEYIEQTKNGKWILREKFRTKYHQKKYEYKTQKGALKVVMGLLNLHD